MHSLVAVKSREAAAAAVVAAVAEGSSVSAGWRTVNARRDACRVDDWSHKRTALTAAGSSQAAVVAAAACTEAGEAAETAEAVEAVEAVEAAPIAVAASAVPAAVVAAAVRILCSLDPVANEQFVRVSGKSVRLSRGCLLHVCLSERTCLTRMSRP